MSRRAVTWTLVLALAVCGVSGDARRYNLRPTANPSAVVAAELAFARAAQEKGQWTAFRACVGVRKITA